ncbi:hypothetical protein QC999_gp88 [Microbacterium phage Cressida]|uniref:Uncharacterized protein n=1 Tax=Microbacterium phage Cressida TaxID=2591216 RepID=A0A514DI16_9CAUD|nr:hypothetical protein QC999_gp88 [Microbacterium phage Cressida]QDH93262.1 hypothetical protein PBI_CRESSIDA_20 [Microbacterium phage Cressida]
MPTYIRCEHCGELRDTSGRYTSPANNTRDAEAWKAEHESGECIGGTMILVRHGPKMGPNRLTLDIGREMAEFLAEVLSDANAHEQDARAHHLSTLIDSALEDGGAEQRIGRG